jgi:excisionase family DNA binding protein
VELLSEATSVVVEPPRLGRSVLIDQACLMLGVSKRTVYYWIRSGRLRTIRTLGGSQRILLESIEELPGRRAPGNPHGLPAMGGNSGALTHC